MKKQEPGSNRSNFLRFLKAYAGYMISSNSSDKLGLFQNLGEEDLTAWLPSDSVTPPTTKPAGVRFVWVLRMTPGRLPFEGGVETTFQDLAAVRSSGDRRGKKRTAIKTGCARFLCLAPRDRDLPKHVVLGSPWRCSPARLHRRLKRTMLDDVRRVRSNLASSREDHTPFPGALGKI